ncbi:putative peroxisomal nicotinamide adenine dinucleotide carrier-like [Capsicum annuum]|uniref:uncharacterized protein LOC107872044 n=1 Tax=Capsicum annuum TaxID=4072 RepID=UPI001FB09BC2|nr:uncharacterized protein LOC107872044 [Capsicum annuum]KAF3637460.1 putative peroxisomal nicotinamide adenine dinucleotide carrier-like [Capsicum annuum]
MVHSQEQKFTNNNNFVIDDDEKELEFDETSSSLSSSSSSDESSGDALYEDVCMFGSGDTNVLQWLLALDLQVMGACRVDERLKPLLKLNVSAGAAEDRLLAHLSQNFDPSEVGMLARCLCIPLVSMRVGKIRKQGTLLCPTATRGNLNFAILPTSDLRISFIGDDGSTERVATFCRESDCSAVEIKDIAADASGRSFLISIPDGETFYFWCSEKSKLLGDELRRKMRDLVKMKPSLAELTGIDESRIDRFAIHLRAYLHGSAAINPQASSMMSRDPSTAASVDSSELGLDAEVAVASQKPLRSEHVSSLGSNTSLMSSLSPMSNAFKDSMLRNSSSACVSRDGPRHHGDSYLSCVDSQIAGTSSTDAPSSTFFEDDKIGKTRPSDVLEPLVAAPHFRGSAATIHSLDSTVLSPYYCWCPPAVSTLQYSVGTPHLPILSTDSSIPFLSSIAPSACSSSHLTPKPSLVADVSPLDFPPLLPEPLIRLPFSLASSQQIPTFTPLVGDSIVHIPVIDVCSSGQGYFVSAGPAISGSIPQLHPNLVNPLIPETTESVAEKSARETLRLLINNSNQPSPQLIDLLPPVLSRSGDETRNMLVTGSRGLYDSTIANDFAIKGLVSLSEKKPVAWLDKKQINVQELFVPMEKLGSSGESSVDDGFMDFEEERKD